MTENIDGNKFPRNSASALGIEKEIEKWKQWRKANEGDDDFDFSSKVISALERWQADHREMEADMKRLRKKPSRRGSE